MTSSEGRGTGKARSENKVGIFKKLNWVVWELLALKGIKKRGNARSPTFREPLESWEKKELVAACSGQ